jgi:DNA-binding CsgD family transcriptional regulator
MKWQGSGVSAYASQGGREPRPRFQVNDNHEDDQLESASEHELYPHLPPTRWRSLHRAAAAAASGDAAWVHRVAAATRVDESLAAELEAAALRSGPAGNGRPGPGQLLEWASDLSADIRGRERRLLKAAVQRVCAGDPGSAELWQRVEACAPSALRSCALAGRAVLDHRRLDAEYHLDRARAYRGGQARIVAAIVPGLRAALLLEAASGGLAVREAAEGLAATQGDRGLERWLTRLLADGRCYTEGPRSALRTLLRSQPNAEQAQAQQAQAQQAQAQQAQAQQAQAQQAQAQQAQAQQAEPEPMDPETALALGCYRVLCGEPAEAIHILSALLGHTGEPLQPHVGVRAHQWLALAHHLLGGWHDADYHAMSAVDAGRQAGFPASAAPDALASLLAAHAGDWATAHEHLRTARALSGGSGNPGDTANRDAAVLTDIAEVMLAHARGSLSPAHAALARLASQAAGDAARKYRSLWLPLQAEWLTESGSRPDAAEALAELRALAEQVPYLQVVNCRLSGRLAEQGRDPQAARRHYESVRDLPQGCLTVPFQVGLLEHCHGRLLAALGDTAGASALLTSARERLASAGAFPYSGRCAADLAARPTAVGTGARPPQLTSRERAVARLVAAGLTNQQAAARLYVSVKTVEYHLAQIYLKLGATSRRQLAGYAEVYAEPAEQQRAEPFPDAP